MSAWMWHLHSKPIHGVHIPMLHGGNSKMKEKRFYNLGNLWIIQDHFMPSQEESRCMALKLYLVIFGHCRQRTQKLFIFSCLWSCGWFKVGGQHQQLCRLDIYSCRDCHGNLSKWNFCSHERHELAPEQHLSSGGCGRRRGLPDHHHCPNNHHYQTQKTWMSIIQRW